MAVPTATMAAITRVTVRDFANVTGASWVAGLDRVFADYRNARVSMLDGMNAVLRSMQGVSDNDVEKFLQSKRSGAAARSNEPRSGLNPALRTPL